MTLLYSFFIKQMYRILYFKNVYRLFYFFINLIIQIWNVISEYMQILKKCVFIDLTFMIFVLLLKTLNSLEIPGTTLFVAIKLLCKHHKVPGRADATRSRSLPA